MNANIPEIEFEMERLRAMLHDAQAELASARADELRTIIGRIKCFAEGTGATIEMVLANPGIGEDAKQLATAVRAAQSAAVAAALEAECAKVRLDVINEITEMVEDEWGFRNWLHEKEAVKWLDDTLKRLAELRARAEGQTGGGK